ncbi:MULTISPECIES: ExbD/TolR family protein [Novosphingobium]|uniref:Outer membrane transport energization protein ExbD n=1 Tax=Novosphingobium mathurense TaxID=428990 RepID=A0A1U6HE93_9SPHN|nr:MULTISPECIES: biopolymer transporter ExbD [Novosphingobium]CDO36805.1 Biopolymer transport protein exbD2 [Novosphingobium sp. KN65.2]SLJ94107.1 outer membrane transport energization protein ExbD [Novosphingobium mathurense]
MAMSGGKDDGSPMMEMNTTPLIDVMLVLLIMFIITIPVATHSIDIDLPVATPPTDTPPPVDPVRNKVVLTSDDKIMWNGNQIDGATLQRLLADTTKIDPEPELQFQPEPQASYDLSAKVLQVIKASQVSKFGFVGNEQYAEFGK